MQSYSVGFRIFDALALQTSDGELCDCFCVVECCEQRYQTETLVEKREMAVFNEAWTWPEISLYDKEFESASIEFSIYERCWFVRNKLIGRASLQLSYVNNRRNHLYARTWLPLRQYEEIEVRGSLNVFVFVIAAGESAPSLAEQMAMTQEEPEEDPSASKKKVDDDDLRGTVLSTEVRLQDGKPHYVYINILRVEDLAPTSPGRYPCAFVTVEFNGSQVTTRVAPEGEQYSFLQAAKMPVMTPIYEDTILIKLWSSNMFSPDDLLAQGLVSFSELRNNALPPQWFNVYGWDLEEVPDLATITASGEPVKPNKFKGRLLISGRVEKVEDDEYEKDGLSPTALIQARTAEEPSTTQVAFLADAYMVVGLNARSCKVQVSYGKHLMETDAVYAGTQITDIKQSSATEDDNDEMHWGLEETVGIFSFKEKQGRFKPAILCMTPDEASSQPDVMVNVLTAGRIGSYVRVGWCMKKLLYFSRYEAGNPARPQFLALEPMPGQKTENTGISVLITIEYNNSDDVIRHKRKEVRPMLYIVRAYCFMARNIDDGSGTEEPGNYALHVLCSGMSSETQARQEVRPLWMEHQDIKVVLFSDSRSEPPTVEPITVSLLNVGALGSTEIGKASCVYTRMRKKDTLDKWEPYNFNPQWIQVFGGQYGNKPVGEVLIGFELLMWKNREEPRLAPREMWPQAEDNYVASEHYCRLKQATLHFAMMGLRDLPKLGGMTGGHVQKPEVTVSLPSWRSPFDDCAGEQDTLTFPYENTVPGGDPRLKEFQLRNWLSKGGNYAQTGYFSSNEMKNFEFLKFRKMNIEIPEKMIFQPWIKIQVVEGAEGVLAGKQFIGESLQGLHDHLPCCWYPDVDPDKKYDEQTDLIRKQIRAAKEESSVRPCFEQLSKEEFEIFLKQERKEQLAKSFANQLKLVKMDQEAPARIDNFAIPIELRSLPTDVVRPLMLVDSTFLNMQRETGFSPRQGPDIREQGQEASRPIYRGKLETSRDYRKALWFSNVPLLRNKDILAGEDDAVDWHFGTHYGFIKCAYKLVDGWEEPKEGDEDDDDGGKSDDDDKDDDDLVDSDELKLRQTFDLHPDLVKFAFDKDKFVEKFKAPQNIPSRVRVRVYLLKAICIFAKGSGFADPYVEVQLGKSNNISMKNMKDPVSTNTPSFNIMQERDVELPMDSRLEVSIMDSEDMSISGDALIGSTVIDLEDRWHSKKWKMGSDRQLVPIESRNVFVPGAPDRNNGCIQMFIEMLESSQASDKKPSPLISAGDTFVEIRMVVRSAEVMSLGEDEFMDVSVGAVFDCDKYEGQSPISQETDIHYHSDGLCKYDWRVVFPKIRTPVLNCIVEIRLYQASAVFGNTMLGSTRLDLKRYTERVAATMDKVDLPAVPLKMTGGPNDDPNEDIGTVTLEAVIMSDAEAQDCQAGLGRDQPNAHPALFTPTEGRGWDAYLAGMGMSIPWPSWWKKLIPLVITAFLFLASVVVMKQMGLM